MMWIALTKVFGAGPGSIFLLSVWHLWAPLTPICIQHLMLLDLALTYTTWECSCWPSIHASPSICAVSDVILACLAQTRMWTYLTRISRNVSSHTVLSSVIMEVLMHIGATILNASTPSFTNYTTNVWHCWTVWHVQEINLKECDNPDTNYQPYLVFESKPVPVIDQTQSPLWALPLSNQDWWLFIHSIWFVIFRRSYIKQLATAGWCGHIHALAWWSCTSNPTAI